MENPIKMDDLGASLFLEAHIYPKQPGARVFFGIPNSDDQVVSPLSVPQAEVFLKAFFFKGNESVRVWKKQICRFMCMYIYIYILYINIHTIYIQYVFCLIHQHLYLGPLSQPVLVPLQPRGGISGCPVFCWKKLPHF